MHLKEEEGDNADTSEEDNEDRREADGDEEYQHQDGNEDQGGDARRVPPQFAWQVEVVRRRKYRIDLSAGRVVQEGR
jgi:hypothetical protein